MCILCVVVVAAAAAATNEAAATTPTAAPTAGAASAARVPQSFVGMMLAAPIFDRALQLPRQLDVMVASGVESLRVVFNWAVAEPYPGWADVPAAQVKDFQDVGGIPINFTVTDKFVALAAERGLSILPIVLDTPDWAAATHVPTQYNLPSSNATYARYVGALVSRYGPHGSFWHEHPGITPVPIRMWQIWNEPNLTLYWSIQPFAPTYVALLKAAHDTIKRLDPGAKVVLAGMPNRVWEDLATIYAVPGARELFDVVAVHPFTSQAVGVITILDRVRAVMDQNGDTRKPIVVTELSWPSSLGQAGQHFGFETTAAWQAQRLRDVLPLLVANRVRLRLRGFYYYTWVGVEYRGASSFSFAGLFRFDGKRYIAKPAYAVFRHAALAIESCHAKAAVATTCERR